MALSDERECEQRRQNSNPLRFSRLRALLSFPMASQPPSALAAAQQFIAWDVNEETRAQARALVEAGDVSAFASRLEFGTAGLRGPMGPGYARMNDLVVLQTAQVRLPGESDGVGRRGAATQGQTEQETRRSANEGKREESRPPQKVLTPLSPLLPLFSRP